MKAIKLSPAQQVYVNKIKDLGSKGYRGTCEEKRTAEALIKKGVIYETKIGIDYVSFLVEKEEVEPEQKAVLFKDANGNSVIIRDVVRMGVAVTKTTNYGKQHKAAIEALKIHNKKN